MFHFIVRTMFVLLSCVCLCEAGSRTWTSKAGTQIEAELKKRQGDRVTLLTEKGRQLTVKLSDLSKEDQQYLDELLIEEAGTEIQGIAAEPGKISGAIQCAGSKWTYHVYLPKQFHMARKWPVWFIMSPGGGEGGGMLQRYIQGAESTGCILVGSVESRNGFDQSQAAMEAMADDVYKRFPVETNFAFASGFSGGSRQSFLLAETNPNIAGLIACGSGSAVYPDGTAPREAEIRKKTVVYSLVGSNCFNRTGVYKTHKKLSDSCRLRFFPGDHVWADDGLLEQGMMHVMGQAIQANKSLEPYKEEYLASLKVVAEKIRENTPWESYHLATLGAELDEGYEQRFFPKLEKELESNPKVELALKAEKDMLKLCSMFYEQYDYFNGDKNDLPKRTKKGEELAEPYSEIPHGELLRKLGQKSN